jgi:hypothetical protein
MLKKGFFTLKYTFCLLTNSNNYYQIADCQYSDLVEQARIIA